MSARKRRTRSRSGATNSFAHGGKKRRTKLNLVHSSPLGGGGGGPGGGGGGAISVVQAHEVLRDKAVRRRVQFPHPPSPEESHSPPPTSALDVPAAGPADFSLSQDKDNDQNEGTFIRMTPNYSPPPPMPGGLAARQTSDGGVSVVMTPPVGSSNSTLAAAAVTLGTSQSNKSVSASTNGRSSSSSMSSSSSGAPSKTILQSQPPADSDPKFDLKFTPPSALPPAPLGGESADRTDELFPLSVDSLPNSSADSGIAGLNLSADSVTSTSSGGGGGGGGLGQSSSSSSSSSSSASSSSQNDDQPPLPLSLSLTPSTPSALPAPPSSGASASSSSVGVLVPTESLSRILVDNALSVGDHRAASSASSRSRDKLLPLNREEQLDMDGDAAQALLSLSQNSDKGGGATTTSSSSSPGSTSVATPSPLPPNSLASSYSNPSSSSSSLKLMTNGLHATPVSSSSSSSSSLLSGSVPMPLVGGGLGKGKNRIFFGSPVLPPLPPALSSSTPSSSSGSGGNAPVVPISAMPKYLPPPASNFGGGSQQRSKFLPSATLPNPSSSSSSHSHSPSRSSHSSSSSRSRSRSSMSSHSNLHADGRDNVPIPNGIAVVPMSDDPDTVVVANPEEQQPTSTSSSNAAEVRAALASIGATRRGRAAPSGLSLRTAVFVRDEMIDTNNADPVPTATALTVKCFLDAASGADGSGRRSAGVGDLFGASASSSRRSDGLPVCMRIIAQRGTKKFFRGSRVEFIFQGHEYDEANEENWFDRIFSVEYAFDVAVSDPFCVTLSPPLAPSAAAAGTGAANALPTALVLTMRITPHLSTAVVSTARRKKQKRRKKTADLEHMTLTFQMARGHGDFASGNLLAESTVELYISPRSTWEKQRTKKHRR